MKNFFKLLLFAILGIIVILRFTTITYASVLYSSPLNGTDSFATTWSIVTGDVGGTFSSSGLTGRAHYHYNIGTQDVVIKATVNFGFGSIASLRCRENVDRSTIEQATWQNDSLGQVDEGINGNYASIIPGASGALSGIHTIEIDCLGNTITTKIDGGTAQSATANASYPTSTTYVGVYVNDGTTISNLVVCSSTDCTYQAQTLTSTPTPTTTPSGYGPGWTSLGLGNQANGVKEVQVDPTNSNILYAFVPGVGFFKSTDAGTTWNTINNGLPDPSTLSLYEFALDPVSTNVLYAVSGGNCSGCSPSYTPGVFKSTDGGSSWTNISANISVAYPGFKTVVIDPNNHNTVYVGSANHCNNLWRSTDAGNTWTQLPWPNCDVSALAVDRQNSNILYGGETSVYKSIDDVSTWTVPDPNFNLGVWKVAIDPTNANVVYANTRSQGNLYKSTDAGVSWNLVLPGTVTDQWYTAITDPTAANTVYAALTNGSISKSTDGGTTWNPITIPNGGIAHGLLVSATNSSLLYAATTKGVYVYNYNLSSPTPTPTPTPSLQVSNVTYNQSTGKLDFDTNIDVTSLGLTCIQIVDPANVTNMYLTCHTHNDLTATATHVTDYISEPNCFSSGNMFCDNYSIPSNVVIYGFSVNNANTVTSQSISSVFLTGSLTPTPTPTPTPTAGYSILSKIIPTNLNGPTDVAINPITHKGYIETGDDTEVFDTTTNQILGTLPRSNNCSGWSVAVNPNTNKVYIGTYCGELLIVDGNTNQLITTLFSPGTGYNNQIAINQTTNKIYYAYSLNKLSVIDGNNNSVVTTLTGGSGTHTTSVAVNSVTNKIYVSNWEGALGILDGATNTLTKTQTDFGVSYLTVNEVTNKVYLNGGGSDGLDIIDGSTLTKQFKALPYYYGGGISVDPQTNRLFVSKQADINGNYKGFIQILDGNTLQTVDTVTFNGGGNQFAMTFDSQSLKLYATILHAIAIIGEPNTKPTINPITAGSVSEGGSFYEVGSFIDSDSTSWTGTVDYGDGSGVQSLSISGNTFTLDHTYLIPGSYSVTVTLTDNQGATTTQTTNVTVNNIDPSVGAIDVPITSVTLGDAVNLSVNFTDSGSTETHIATIDWGDGTSSAGTVTESNGSGSVTGTHIYSTSGNYTIKVSVADNYGGSSYSTTTVTVNTPPTANAGGPYVANEGDMLVLSGSGTDPDGDALTYSWDVNNDGIYDTTGQSTIYSAVDGPEDKTVVLKVCDTHNACATSTATLTIANVSPTVESITAPTDVISVNTAVNVSGAFTDLGVLDTHTAVWDFGDGSSPEDGTVTESNGSGSVTGSHTYITSGPHTITLTVTDNDQGTGSKSVQIVVNTPPVPNANGPYTVNEGSDMTLHATGTDVDNDSLTYAWDLDNNGTYETAQQDATYHGVDGPATKTVGLQVCDTHNACATRTTTVTINNVAPTVDAITVSSVLIPVNTTLTASANFIDPGVLDTHTVVWNWGDTTTTSGTITETNGSGVVSGSYAYAVPGVYMISVTVKDNNLDSGFRSYDQYVVVYDPNGGFVTGSGQLDSPEGAESAASSATGKAMFGVNAKYQSGATVPTGNTKFTFKNGGFDFASTSYDWMTVNGNTVFLHGQGQINGGGSYTFLASMIDGNPDTFRIQITDSSSSVLYDNQSGDNSYATPSEALAVGQIKVQQ